MMQWLGPDRLSEPVSENSRQAGNRISTGLCQSVFRLNGCYPAN
jgi:hypothetical protein